MQRKPQILKFHWTEVNAPSSTTTERYPKPATYTRQPLNIHFKSNQQQSNKPKKYAWKLRTSTTAPPTIANDISTKSKPQFDVLRYKWVFVHGKDNSTTTTTRPTSTTTTTIPKVTKLKQKPRKSWSSNMTYHCSYTNGCTRSNQGSSNAFSWQTVRYVRPLASKVVSSSIRVQDLKPVPRSTTKSPAKIDFKPSTPSIQKPPEGFKIVDSFYLPPSSTQNKGYLPPPLKLHTEYSVTSSVNVSNVLKSTSTTKSTTIRPSFHSSEFVTTTTASTILTSNYNVPLQPVTTTTTPETPTTTNHFTINLVGKEDDQDSMKPKPEPIEPLSNSTSGDQYFPFYLPPPPVTTTVATTASTSTVRNTTPNEIEITEPELACDGCTTQFDEPEITTVDLQPKTTMLSPPVITTTTLATTASTLPTFEPRETTPSATRPTTTQSPVEPIDFGIPDFEMFEEEFEADFPVIIDEPDFSKQIFQ